MLAAVRALWARFRALFRSRELDREFDDEWQSHLAMLTEDNIGRGMTPETARRAALIRVGALAPLKEQHREVRGLRTPETLLQDLRFAARLLAKERAFTAAVVFSLALGIGVNTAVFTIVNGWNLQDLPVDEPHRIMHLATLDAQGRARGVSYLDFVDWQKASRAFSGLAAYAGASMNIAVDGHPAEHLAGTFMSANAFSLLRERPVIGRDFRPDDDRAGAEPVVIIGHAVWSDLFGAEPSAIGRTIRVNGAPATIIGVMPAGFMFPVLSDMWLPLTQMPGMAAQPRDMRTLDVFGRLADDTLEQARAELSTIAAALAEQFPASNRDVQATVEKFTERFFGPPPAIILVAVGFVLLIACANAANLLLARAAHRAPEMSLRRALGATRGRIVRQVLTESLLLSGLAGLCGLLIAWPIVGTIAAETADFGLPYWARLAFDGRVFGFLAAVCVGTAILFGLVPAWKLSAARTGEALKDASRTMSAGVRSRRWISGLLIAELALSVVLLASAALLIRSAVLLYQADQIIDGRRLLTARISLPPAEYGTAQQRLMFYERLEERLGSISSIASAAIGTALPFAGATRRDVVLDTDVEAAASGGRPALMLAIGSTYFDTVGLTLRRGRAFDARDGLPGQDVAIVNEQFAEAYFAEKDVLGRRIRFIDGAPTPSSPVVWLTIIGIAPTVRHSPGAASPVVYVPLRAQPTETVRLIVRGKSEGIALAPLLREQVRRLDADLPLYNISTLERVSEQSRWIPRAVSSLLTLFAVFATLLSAVGLYAVTTYSMSQRTSEIGIRMALGAQRRQVSWLFVSGTLGHVALGLAIGIIGAMAVAQLLRSTLAQTNALDPLTLAGVAVLMGIVAVVACFVPTWRASARDPALALRHE